MNTANPTSFGVASVANKKKSLHNQKEKITLVLEKQRMPITAIL